MNAVSRQAAIGVFIAAVLMFGANAGADIRPGAPHPRVSIDGTQLALSYRVTGADLAAALLACRAKLLDLVLDAAGEAAARLKQF